MSFLRLLVGFALLVVGACAAGAATLIHERAWGLVLGLATAASLTRALPAGWWRCAFMVGWFGAVSYLVLPRAEGDYLVAGSPAGYGFLAGSFLVFLAALATCPDQHRPASRPPLDADDLHRGGGT